MPCIGELGTGAAAADFGGIKGAGFSFITQLRSWPFPWPPLEGIWLSGRASTHFPCWDLPPACCWDAMLVSSQLPPLPPPPFLPLPPPMASPWFLDKRPGCACLPLNWSSGCWLGVCHNFFISSMPCAESWTSAQGLTGCFFFLSTVPPADWPLMPPGATPLEDMAGSEAPIGPTMPGPCASWAGGMRGCPLPPGLPPPQPPEAFMGGLPGIKPICWACGCWPGPPSPICCISCGPGRPPRRSLLFQLEPCFGCKLRFWSARPPLVSDDGSLPMPPPCWGGAPPP
mmetsp:Transcript_57774/g.161179  ORF Transcript_57774/g.161179 Transcript_57774/m.161179 type:complete len:285 (-) Transcript_57774:757-1611(-)